MSVILRNIQIPLFIKIETGIFKHIRTILDENHLHFKKPLVLTSEHMLDIGGKDIVHELNDCAIRLVSDNSLQEAEKIANELREKNNDVVISIGGGRIVDVGKYAATKARINYISIPTSPSNDGLCSPVAVLKNESGMTESINVQMPIGILVDTSIMQSVPLSNIRAGIGDLLSNRSAIADWKIAHEDGKEQIDDFAASIASSAAELIYETCFQKNVDIQGTAFLDRLTHGLILSGIAMNIAGSSRPCSGSEHKISHAIDSLYPDTALHGIQVAFGTLMSTVLRGQSIDHLLDFYRSVGLPTTLQELGLTKEQFVQVLEHAPKTREQRYTILEKRNLSTEEIEKYIEEFL